MNQKHDREFWENIVKLVEDDGVKLSFIMSQYQITRSSYYYWRNRLRDERGCSESDQAKENKRLMRENLELKMENEILKKPFRLSGESSHH